jgi:aspartyl-tRNA(Asn)/glutamyl-tRNA(Gln) amidotransferase subunit A
MINKIKEQIDNKKISVKEIAEEYIAKAQNSNPELNAYISITEDYALSHLPNDPRNKLSGIPGIIKDNINIRGIRTTAGSRILESYVSPYSASVVSNLSDFTLIGKGNMDAFAFGSSTENSGYGVTHNPLDTKRVAGGSSGGVAAAVASGSALFGIGTDTGGSVRQPASFCGVVGLKPTYGLCSRYGLIAMGSSFDTPGVIAGDVYDTAYVLNEIAKYDKKDSTSIKVPKQDYTKFKDIKGLKVGVLDFSKDGVDPDIIDSFENSVKTIKSLGCEVKTIDLAHLKYSLAVYYILVPSEISANLARYDGIRFGHHPEKTKDNNFESLNDFYIEARSKFEDEVKRRIMIGTYTLSSGYYDAYFNKALKVRNIIKQEIKDAFLDVDVIISPTTPSVAFEIGKKIENPLSMYLSDIFTVSSNIVGIPAISIPNGYYNKLPTGLQIMGRSFDESTILSLANLIEQKLWKP